MLSATESLMLGSEWFKPEESEFKTSPIMINQNGNNGFPQTFIELHKIKAFQTSECKVITHFIMGSK